MSEQYELSPAAKEAIEQECVQMFSSLRMLMVLQIRNAIQSQEKIMDELAKMIPNTEYDSVTVGQTPVNYQYPADKPENFKESR